MEFRVIKSFFGRIYAQQLLLVREGAKPAVRIPLYRSELASALELGTKLNMVCLVGQDSIFPTPNEHSSSGFVEWSDRRPVKAGDFALTYVYFGKDINYLQSLRVADERGDDVTTGKLLGYPECCIKCFCFGNFGDNGVSDPVVTTIDDKTEQPWKINPSLICFDFGLILHVPCQANCSQSLVLGATYASVLSRYPDAELSQTQNELRTHVLHTLSLGIISFSACPMANGCVQVSKIRLSEPSSMIKDIVAEGSIVERGQSYLLIDGVAYEPSQFKWYIYE